MQTIQLKRRHLPAFLSVLAAVFLLAGVSVPAQAQSYYGEVYVCDYNGDSDMEDLMKARDYYLSQAEKAEISTPPAFVWTPIKGPQDFDFLWFNFYQSATQYGEQMVAEAASAEMQSVTERFERVASCSSYLFVQEQVYNGGEAMTGETAYLTSSACNFRQGMGHAELADLRRHLTGYLEAAGHTRLQAYQQYSITPTPNSPDVRLFAVHDDAAAWGALTDSLRASDAGRMLDRHWNTVLDCATAHLLGRQVVAAPAEDG